MPDSLHLHLLGGFRLERDGKPIHLPMRLETLIAYLALRLGSPQSRRQLAFLLWPDTTDAQARSNLRILLHRLRLALPNPDLFLSMDAQHVWWRPDAPCALDMIELEQSIVQADSAKKTGDHSAMLSALERAASFCKGDLLPACYDDWIVPERARLRAHMLNVLERLVDIYERRHAYEQAIEYASQMLRIDPQHQAAFLALIRLHKAKRRRGKR
jgi:DNA-binding SARP family transcriptional activator